MASVLANHDAPLLRPMVGLCLWTFTMEAWMYATRIPAISKYNVDVKPEATKEDFNRKIPRSIQWKADNYNHLHEQPTLYYAVALGLTYLGDRSALSTNLAWGYLGLRVVHSLIQAISNTVMVRFQVFLLSSTVLLGMTARLAQLLWWGLEG